MKTALLAVWAGLKAAGTWCLGHLKVLGGLLIALLTGLALLFSRSVPKPIGSTPKGPPVKTPAEVEAEHAPKIAELRTKLDQTAKDLSKSGQDVFEARKALDAAKTQLHTELKASGLSQEEVIKRLKKL